MQTAMLVTAKKLAFRRDTFASGQMNAAVIAAHHILALKRLRLSAGLFLLLFERAPVTSYYPEKKNSNKGEEQDSTQGGISIAELRPTTSS